MRSLRLTNAINGKILDFRELSEIDVSGENYIEVWATDDVVLEQQTCFRSLKIVKGTVKSK